jgi:hypothetical protein
MAKKKSKGELAVPIAVDYAGLLARLATVLEQGRRSTVRTTNAILAATYWEVGRQIVEYEQSGQARAEYGEMLFKRLGQDLTGKYGRGFGWRNLFSMRNVYPGWEILQMPSGKWQARVKSPMLANESGNEKLRTPSAELQPPAATQLPLDPTTTLLDAFPLPWSHYVRLMAVKDDFARWFYEDEAIQGPGR